MSDVPSGVRGPGAVDPVEVPTQATYPTEAYTTEVYAETYSSPSEGQSSQPSGAKEKAKEVASQTGHAAGEAAADVKDTAKQQARRVGDEARTQVSNLASDVKTKVNEQARSQNDRLVGSIRDTADQLDQMRGDRGDTPAAQVVTRIADGGRQFADYLDRNGPEGVLREVQDFARRRPGAFLATALAAGFVVGRLGKSVAKAETSSSDAAKPSSDSFVSNSGTDTTAQYATGYPAATTQPVAAPTGGYASATEYTSTGTGTPSVHQEYVVDSPERPR
ncbi:hypothetical protein [Paractinoplanes atraurantiacus]|uniref:Uncharacterized protein n=1 Tax=Paractinoplanes atraurantiacus TaxID=1036182 RepID=A0A285IMQ1_9ACTN|nr:hypothetical protein [Actinoplanes atraurantiacus]SNY49285.1 hypothetical protein SAMN05421748_109279 [Actinoplanes atraurantiacus]